MCAFVRVTHSLIWRTHIELLVLLVFLFIYKAVTVCGGSACVFLVRRLLCATDYGVENNVSEYIAVVLDIDGPSAECKRVLCTAKYALGVTDYVIFLYI